MQDFLNWAAMGKHGVYVWSAYGIGVAAILLLHWAVRQKQKRLQREIQQLKEEQHHEKT